MNKKINDGGQAFPAVCRATGITTSGMSLRDWFAGQALVELAGASIRSWEDVAESAYTAADAMLAARNPQPPTQ